MTALKHVSKNVSLIYAEKKDKIYKTIMEEGHVDKDCERNLSHFTFLYARKLPEDQKTPKHPQSSVILLKLIHAVLTQ